MIIYKARNKAGRAWIAKILDCTLSVDKVEIDNVTEQRLSLKPITLALLRGFIEIDGRDAVLYEVTPNEFVYLSGATGRYVTKYVLRTYPFDPTGLPVVEATL